MPHKHRSPAAAYLRALKLVHSKRSFPHTSGLTRSFRERRPVDAAGRPLPWINHAAIHLLSERLQPTHTVFEYGAGHSTLFFAERCAAVTSVEHDGPWFDEVRGMAPANVTLLHRPEGPAYWDAIGERSTHYDVVLIDGLARERCLPAASGALSAAGVMLLDDARRPAYTEALRAVMALGFRTLPLKSFRPGGLTESECWVIYRDGNCLGI